jgi:hypothetical protein
MAAEQTNTTRAYLRPLLASAMLRGTVLAGAAVLVWSLVGLRESANGLTIALAELPKGADACAGARKVARFR